LHVAPEAARVVGRVFVAAAVVAAVATAPFSLERT